MAQADVAPIAVAVIGGGFIADYHVNGIRAAGGAEVTVLVSRSAANAARRSVDLGIARWETDYRVVLADPAIDQLVISDSVPPFRVTNAPTNKLVVLPAAALIAASIRRLYDNRGLSDLMAV